MIGWLQGDCFRLIRGRLSLPEVDRGDTVRCIKSGVLEEGALGRVEVKAQVKGVGERRKIGRAHV